MKIILFAVALSSLGLSACQHNTIEDPKFQKAIRALSDPDQAPKAEKKLLGGGKKVLEELLWISQGIGEKAAIIQAAAILKCRESPKFSATGLYSFEKSPAMFAIKSAMRIMLGKPYLADLFSNSTDPFYRAMAVMSQCNDVRRVAGFAHRLKADPSPLVRVVVLATLNGVAEKMDMDEYERLKFENEIAETWNRTDCDASSKSKIVDNIVNGSYRSGMVENSASSMLIGVRRTDGRSIMLCPTCAVAIYEKAATKGAYPYWLLEPILYFGITRRQQLQKAKELILRDLDKYPKGMKNILAARVINAGGNPALFIKFPENQWESLDPVIIEALARQKQPVAQHLIKKYVLCEGVFSNEKLVESVGVLKSEVLLNELFDIAEKCHGGLVPAFLGLLRAYDSRASSLLTRIMKMDFLEDEIILDLQELATPEICTKLKMLAESGKEHAKTILRKIRPHKCSAQSVGIKQ